MFHDRLDEDLIQRLPLPLAQLFRRAHNAKTPLERHLAAYYLWEASLKLLGSIAIIEYGALGDHDEALSARLQNLARPTVGHWWEFVRRLVPVLAESGNPSFRSIRDLVLGRKRDDMPRSAGLDAALRETLEGTSGARATVRVTELFNRLVQYRNREIGHGATGQRGNEYYDAMAFNMVSGIAEILSRLNVLAGNRLIYIADVRRQTSGSWLVERFDLTGETPRRIESLEYSREEVGGLPETECLYTAHPGEAGGESRAMSMLHPLVFYDADRGDVFFLNGRRGRRHVEYLCYGSGEVIQRDRLEKDHRQFLERALGGPVDEATVEQWASNSQAEDDVDVEELPAQPSRTIGEFELLSRIGRGGMGVVYRAWQPSLGRQVALKCLYRTGDPKSEARFAREIRALGRVEHPNLVKIFTSGSEGDQWFYAMEVVDGPDLGTVCGKLSDGTASEIDESDWHRAITTAYRSLLTQEEILGDSSEHSATPHALVEETSAPVSGTHSGVITVKGGNYVKQVVEIIRQVATAAHALHESGVVHRDIKPGNIMLTHDGTHAVLMDLGLAQLADDTEGRLTRTRHFVGTMRYSSPEQILAAGRLDRRSDIYSLGVTLWELLTLRPMYGATDATPDLDLMHRIQFDEPERPRKYHPGIPADLEAIVLRCLEKNPERRYYSAAELAQDLARWQNGDPVTAQPPTLRYVLGKYISRHKLRITAIACLGLAVLVGALAAIIMIDKARREAEQALAQAGRANNRALVAGALELSSPDLVHARAIRATDINLESAKFLGWRVYAPTHGKYRLMVAIAYTPKPEDPLPHDAGMLLPYEFPKANAGREFLVTVVLFKVDGGWMVKCGVENDPVRDSLVIPINYARRFDGVLDDGTRQGSRIRSTGDRTWVADSQTGKLLLFRWELVDLTRDGNYEPKLMFKESTPSTEGVLAIWIERVADAPP